MIFSSTSSQEALSRSDVSNHILVEAIRDGQGVPTLLGLVRLVDGYSRGQITLDPDSQAAIDATASKLAEVPGTTSWGAFTEVLVQTIASGGNQEAY